MESNAPLSDMMLTDAEATITSMSPQLVLTGGEDEARPAAKRRSVSPAFATLHLGPSPYTMPLPADEGEDGPRVLAKRRSVAVLRDLQVLPEPCFRKLSAVDLVGVVDQEPCAFRNLHFDEPPPETASMASTAPASRRGSRAGAGTPEAASGAASRRGSSCCYSCHDAAVIANRRRVSCLTEGAATPAMYQCNGARCGGSHHCPEAFDDPCCGAPAASDFWVQAYCSGDGRRKPGKRQRSKGNAKGSGARRASRASATSNGKRQSIAALALDVEAEKAGVTQDDKKRRWVVYIFATFVVMLVALAILMVIVSLTMSNRDKPMSKAAALAVTPETLLDELND